MPKQIAVLAAAMLLKIMESSDIELQESGVQELQADQPSLASLHSQIRLVLQECDPFESQRQLRAFFAHPQLKSWRNRLPEEHRLGARVDGVIALLHQRTHVGTGSNALVLLLNILSEYPDTDEDLRPVLKSLATQLEVALANKD